MIRKPAWSRTTGIGMATRSNPTLSTDLIRGDLDARVPLKAWRALTLATRAQNTTHAISWPRASI